jgi:hypothetical protein
MTGENAGWKLISHDLGIPTTPSAATALPTSAVSATHAIAIDHIRRWNMSLMRSIRFFAGGFDFRTVDDEH